MMASTSAGSGWTTSRIIALAAGSVLLLISLAFIAGGGTLAWADTEQLRSGYLTTTTTTYSTSGYALVSDPIKPYGAWGWLSLFVDRARIRISSPDRSRPLFLGIAAAGDVERYLGESATRRWAPVANTTSPIIRAPGPLRLRRPRCVGP